MSLESSGDSTSGASCHCELRRRPNNRRRRSRSVLREREWREAIEEPEEQERPDQNWILSVIEQYLGTPADLYRRSIDPDTGDVTLGFHFPEVARLRYAEAIDAAAEETGVSITLSP